MVRCGELSRQREWHARDIKSEKLGCRLYAVGASRYSTLE